MQFRSRRPLFSIGLFITLVGSGACSAGGGKDPGSETVGPHPQSDASTGSDDGIMPAEDAPGGISSDAIAPMDADLTSTVDPTTCDEAAKTKAYVGCDFWPTVVANAVWSIFDYAVVVANASDDTVTVDVTGNGIAKKTVTV